MACRNADTSVHNCILAAQAELCRPIHSFEADWDAIEVANKCCILERALQTALRSDRTCNMSGCLNTLITGVVTIYRTNTKD